VISKRSTSKRRFIEMFDSDIEILYSKNGILPKRSTLVSKYLTAISKRSTTDYVIMIKISGENIGIIE
jgi:hypothetical protein